MALINPYCSVASVIGGLRNRDVPLREIEDAINAASRYIDHRSGMDWGYHDHSSTPLKVGEHSELIRGDTLFIPYTNILGITEVKVQGAVWDADVDYVVSGLRLVAISTVASWDARKRWWPVGPSPEEWTEIKGTFGYSRVNSETVPTNLPSNIEQACQMIACAISGYLTRDTVGLDGAKVSLIDSKIPKEALALLPARRVFT